MLERRIKCCAWILMLSAILAAAPARALAADASDLAGRAATWEKEYNAANIKAVAALYAADGCRMPPNAKTAQGSEAIQAQLESLRKLGKSKITVTTTETSGDLAYGTGTYEILSADGTHVDHGKWMNVSKKLKGTWKIQCDIWNSDMPIPTGKAK